MIERRRFGAARRIDQQELGAGERSGAIPEPVVRQPVGRYRPADYEAVQVLREEPLGSRVIGGREGRPLRAQWRDRGER
jgi:hypothetical protein